jgi:hypothetical protein
MAGSTNESSKEQVENYRQHLLMDNELILVRDLKKISFLFIEIFYE